MTVKNIEKKVLELNAKSRAKLANKLLSSLEDLSEKEIEKLWAEESLRRKEEIIKGKVKLRAAEEVISTGKETFQMIKSASFHPMAEMEMNEAAEFYETRELGLGTSFIDEVERAINSIRQYPESAHIIVKSIRRKILWRFPYSLMYSTNADDIFILAVASQKRRPFYWRNRK